MLAPNLTALAMGADQTSESQAASGLLGPGQCLPEGLQPLLRRAGRCTQSRPDGGRDSGLRRCGVLAFMASRGHTVVTAAR
jgi:hypothetical protein